MLGHGLHLDGVAEVGLVGAVLAHRHVIGNARHFLANRLAAGELRECLEDHGLHGGEEIVLRDEAHFEVELVELARQTVGARILVAEAGRDLEVAVEARHHEQLLVLLRRLRQREELAGMDARRHEEVARAFGRRGGEDRRREFVEADCVHLVAQRRDDAGAGHDVLVQRLAAKVEEAVLEAGVFRIVRLAENRQRQFGRLRQHFDLGRKDLDGAGGEFAVLGAGGARADLAVNPDHPFRTHLLGRLECGGIGVGHHLGHAVVVAQVDEENAAVIAHAVDPAGKAGFAACMFGAEPATGVAAVTVSHENLGKTFKFTR